MCVRYQGAKTSKVCSCLCLLTRGINEVCHSREGVSTLNLNLIQRTKTPSRRDTMNRRAFGNHLDSGIDERVRPFTERNEGREAQNVCLFKSCPVLCAHRKQARTFSPQHWNTGQWEVGNLKLGLSWQFCFMDVLQYGIRKSYRATNDWGTQGRQNKEGKTQRYLIKFKHTACVYFGAYVVLVWLYTKSCPPLVWLMSSPSRQQLS